MVRWDLDKSEVEYWMINYFLGVAMAVPPCNLNTFYSGSVKPYNLRSGYKKNKSRLVEGLPPLDL